MWEKSKKQLSNYNTYKTLLKLEQDKSLGEFGGV